MHDLLSVDTQLIAVKRHSSGETMNINNGQRIKNQSQKSLMSWAEALDPLGSCVALSIFGKPRVLSHGALEWHAVHADAATRNSPSTLRSVEFSKGGRRRILRV